MLRRQLHEVPDAELHAAINAARGVAGSESLAVLRLGEYGLEAARRLVDPSKARRAALGTYWRGVGRRSVVILWWLHVAGVGFLCLVVLEEIDRRSGWAAEPLVVAAALAGTCIAIRWIFTGGWRFGPPRA